VLLVDGAGFENGDKEGFQEFFLTLTGRNYLMKNQFIFTRMNMLNLITKTLNL